MDHIIIHGSPCRRRWKAQGLSEHQTARKTSRRLRLMSSNLFTPSNMLMSLMPLLLVWTATILSVSVSCSAFLTSSCITITRQFAHHPYPCAVGSSFASRILLPSSPRRAAVSSRRIAVSTRLQVAKTGGKIITTEEQFAEVVLSKNTPRPVMVFFSAPW